MKCLDKEAFMQQYILKRTSHKKTVEDLIRDALYAYEAIKGVDANASSSCILKN